MKFTFRSWPCTLTLATLVAASSMSIVPARAQQPLSRVELAEPVAPPANELPTEATEPAPLAAGPSAPLPSAPAAVDADAVTPVGPGAVPAESSGEPTPAQPSSKPGEPKPAVPTGAEPAPQAVLNVSDDPATVEQAAPQDDAVVELVKERYPSGAIKIEREMTQDADGNYLLHGWWRQYDEQGRLIAEGRYLKNKKEGLWRRFSRAGDAPLLGTSPYKEFEAPFVSQATFRGGRMNGKWTIADAKQRKVHEIDFQDGERHGKAIWYFPTGAVLLQAHYQHGRVSGDVLKFAADATVVAEEHYEDGRRLGQKTEFHDEAKQSKKVEMSYLHAPLVISKMDDFDASTLAIFETRGQDEKHGAFRAWHKNGQLAKQGEFRYGLPVGKVQHWFANGQKQMEGQYVDGRQHGIWTWWHENGQKAVNGEYHDGVAAGQWSWWQPSGKLAQKADLSTGQPVVSAPTQGDEVRTAERPSLQPVLPRR